MNNLEKANEVIKRIPVDVGRGIENASPKNIIEAGYEAKEANNWEVEEMERAIRIALEIIAY